MVVMDFPDQRKRCHEYVDALEEERRKIKVFQRELPLCFELVTQAIDACRKELSGTTTEYNMPTGQSECSEHTSSGCPVLEEFIPIKPHDDDDQGEENGNQDNNSGRHEEDEDGDDDDDHHHYHFQDERLSLKRTRSDDMDDDDEDILQKKSNDHNKKSEWLRSVQLWNQSPDPLPAKEEVPRKAVVKEVKRSNGGGGGGSGGAFHPFQKEKSSCVGKSNSTAPNHDKVSVVAKPAAAVPPATVTAAMSSNADRAAAVAATAAAVAGTSGGGGCSISNNNNSNNSNKTKDVDKEGQAQRKQRRCWSPELHRRFLHALQQLGGSHAATPKQIRELMKVDGLSNDEVKSHLQVCCLPPFNV
ncbi:Transcription factor HHO3 [Linum perenne]